MRGNVKTSNFTDSDAIRAHGSGIDLADCEFCVASRKMDDLHRNKAARMDDTIAAMHVHIDFLVSEITRHKRRAGIYRLVIFGVSVVAALALAANADWLK